MDSYSDDDDADPPMKEEDVPDDAIAPAQSPAPSAHLDEPNSPPFSSIHYAPGPPVEIDLPHLSPGSDVPSTISSEAAEYGEIGQFWE